MSQFFGTNPASRPAAGPKLEAWQRDLPHDWRAGLGLKPSQDPREPAKDDAESSPSDQG